ncbi:MAG: hypothetical protein FLDDKLPJ_02479 [Phycisphaerae bacterium]|nr:hypothetical protein [Phycisphaerae bacterium]
MSWTQDLRLALNLWETLCACDPRTLKPASAAAEFPPEVSADGLTWTFRLRDDGRWSDGTPVTAADFVRGWRRLIEPGTAADYAFFVTDYVEGAAEYVSWRGEGVGVLTALSRLAEGWSIDDGQALVLATAECAEIVRRAYAEATGNVAEPEAFSGSRMARAALPWGELHRRVFEAHAAELEAGFAKVGLEAADDRTLIVRFRKPCPFFADLAAFPVLAPMHPSVDEHRERWRGAPLTREGLVAYDSRWTRPVTAPDGAARPVTNGPYRLVEWRFKRSVRLEVNPHHRDASRIGCRSVEAVVFADANSALLAYEAGDVDFIPTVEVSYDHAIFRLAESGARPDFKLTPLAATYFFNFNCADVEVDGRPNPFVDPRVRRAFSLALDREAIARRVLQRGDRPAATFIPPETLPGYDTPEGMPFDPEAGRRLLGEAGHPQGRGLPVIDVLFNTSGAHPVVGQAIARQWETHLGVRVELRGKESKAFAEDKARRRFMISQANWYADYNDPTTFLDVLAAGNGNNDSGYASAAFDALLARAATADGPEARMRLLREAEATAVMRDAAILPVFHYTSVIAVRGEVEGLHPNSRLWFPFSGVTVAR